MGIRLEDEKPDKIERGKLGDFHDMDELLAYLKGEIRQNSTTNKDLWDEKDFKNRRIKKNKDGSVFGLLDHLLYEQLRLELLVDLFTHKIPNQIQYSQEEFYITQMEESIGQYKMKIFENIFSEKSSLDENLEKIFNDSFRSI